MTSVLQFTPFVSSISAGFWHKFAQLKLEKLRLDESPVEIVASYGHDNKDGLPCMLNIDYTTFDINHPLPHQQFISHGTIKNFNIVDKFKSCDKKELLNITADKLWSDITSGEAIDDPSLLSVFNLITYGDLKKYTFIYWFCFPAISFPEPIQIMNDPLKITERFSEKQMEELISQYNAIWVKNENEKSSTIRSGYFAITFGTPLKIIELKEIESLPQKAKFMLAFCDPSTLEKNPGWPLRNLLALAGVKWYNRFGNDDVRVLCFRQRFTDGKCEVNHSIILNLKLTDLSAVNVRPSAVGWEKNDEQKLCPKSVNLAASMNPSMLSEAAVNLNLKLMRWRLLPDLELDPVSQSKCLLLGAGTLGCNVARALAGWGVRHITFVDYGTVSYSNPVRQSLFTFEDSLNGGKHKAHAAAEGLRRIVPGITTKGIVLPIPMPGHPLPERIMNEVRSDVKELEKLIKSHDVVFLLMDTRESRWLPTVIGAAERKLVMNAGLGFDTYLVMRHGVSKEGEVVDYSDCSMEVIKGSHLGCYFCNDVVAPGNSLQDRTLDQQCTVARPGLSMVASALLVEMFVSLLQHDDGAQAPAQGNRKDDDLTRESECCLGVIPHMIRGFMSRFQQVLPACQKFDKCTACSDPIIENYKTHGFEFLKKAFIDTTYIEDLSGLTKLHAAVNDLECEAFFDDQDF